MRACWKLPAAVEAQPQQLTFVLYRTPAAVVAKGLGFGSAPSEVGGLVAGGLRRSSPTSTGLASSSTSVLAYNTPH